MEHRFLIRVVIPTSGVALAAAGVWMGWLGGLVHGAAGVAAGAATFAIGVGQIALVPIYLRRSASFPVSRLSRAVRAMEEGDYDVGDLCRVRESDGEIADLARGVRRLARISAKRQSADERLRNSLMRVATIQDKILSSLSHELRTPLASIRSIAEILKSELADHATADLAAGLLSETLRMERHIDRMLQAGGEEIAADEIDIREHDLAELIRRSIDGQRDEARERGVELVGSTDGRIAVLADAERVREALDGLIENALRFAPSGTAVTIRGGLAASPGFAEVTVRDRGPGVDPAVRPLIFMPFLQGGDVLTGKPQGIGLGLPWARRVLRAQGGDVGLEDSGPDGSTFRMVLPLAAGPEAAVESGASIELRPR